MAFRCSAYPADHGAGWPRLGSVQPFGPSVVSRSVIEFMERGSRLEDLSGVLALNDLMAVYFPTFFLGLTSSLEAVILPREEHRLELLLAKACPCCGLR